LDGICKIRTKVKYSHKRYKENDRSREIFKKFVTAYPQPKNWLKWAKFEEANTNIDISREIYNSCMQTLGEEYIDQNVYISFAKFETRQKQIERSRVIYKYALEKLPEGQKENLYNVYTQFEKQYGGREGIEDVVISKRRVMYEDVYLYLNSGITSQSS
jgi:crooked neck